MILPDGSAFMLNTGLPRLAADRTYQLWGVVHGQTVSLGLLGSQPGDVAFSVNPSAPVRTFAVTDEVAGWRRALHPRPGGCQHHLTGCRVAAATVASPAPRCHHGRTPSPFRSMTGPVEVVVGQAERSVTMSLPKVVSRDEWLVERQKLLAEEKAMTRSRRDAAERQAPRAAHGRGGEGLRLRGPGRDGAPASTCSTGAGNSWSSTSCSIRRGTRDVRAAPRPPTRTRPGCAPTCGPGTRTSWPCRAPRSTRSSVTRPPRGGRSRGTRPSAATSTTTST